MDHDTRAWLISFIEDDIPCMSAAEILHRIAALREIERADGGGGMLEPDALSSRSYSALHIDLLLEELKGRGPSDATG